MEIVWDEPKRLANLDKHGLDFAELDEIFFEGAVVLPSHTKAVGSRLASTITASSSWCSPGSAARA